LTAAAIRDTTISADTLFISPADISPNRHCHRQPFSLSFQRFSMMPPPIDEPLRHDADYAIAPLLLLSPSPLPPPLAALITTPPPLFSRHTPILAMMFHPIAIFTPLPP